MSSETIDPGIYRARATQGQLGKHEKSKNDQAVVIFEILDGVYAGRTIRWYAVITDKTQRFVIPGLAACGWTGQIGDDGRSMIGITEHEVDIEIVHEEYEGKMSVKVRGVVDPDASIAGKPMDPGERANFMSRYGGAIEQAAAAKRAARERRGEGDNFHF
jgi:hypothetical protein